MFVNTLQRMPCFATLGHGDPMPFWKSASYLAHFMHGYKVNRLLDETLEKSPDKVGLVLKRHKNAFLGIAKLKRWNRIEPGNAKMRDLTGSLLDSGMWKLLWIPPTLPYWPLKGPFVGMETVTKTLLFSAWNVVPDVVSGILSYEAERRMVQGQIRKIRPS